jgi:hypothetical protein
MSYLFFVTKVDLVRGFERSKIYELTVKATRYGLLIFLPLFVVPTAAVITESIITPDGFCTLFITQLWFPALFIFGNAGLTFVLLFLFLMPIWQITKHDVNEGNRKRMQKVARKNFYLTCFMTFMSSGSVVITCVATAFALANKDEYYWFLLSSYVTTALDLLICCVCARFMTNIWVPNGLKRMWMRSASSDQDNSDPSSHPRVDPSGRFPAQVHDSNQVRNSVRSSNQPSMPTESSKTTTSPANSMNSFQVPAGTTSNQEILVAAYNQN